MNVNHKMNKIKRGHSQYLTVIPIAAPFRGKISRCRNACSLSCKILPPFRKACSKRRESSLLLEGGFLSVDNSRKNPYVIELVFIYFIIIL